MQEHCRAWYPSLPDCVALLAFTHSKSIIYFHVFHEAKQFVKCVSNPNSSSGLLLNTYFRFLSCEGVFVNCTTSSHQTAPIWTSYSPFLSVSSVPQGVRAITTRVWAAGPQVVGAMGNTVLQFIQSKRLGEQLSLYLSSFANVFAWVDVAGFSYLGGRWTGKVAVNSFLTAKRLNILLEVGELKWHFWGKSCNYPSSCRSR